MQGHYKFKTLIFAGSFRHKYLETAVEFRVSISFPLITALQIDEHATLGYDYKACEKVMPLEQTVRRFARYQN
jgi:hypothetical protein